MKTLLALLALTITSAHAQIPVPNVPPKTNHAIQLWWDASPTPGASSILRRGVAPGKYDEMVQLQPGVTTYIWTNSPSKLTNYFVVSAVATYTVDGVNYERESAASNEVAAEPLPIVEPPILRKAVPVTVEIYRREPGALWAKPLVLGPFYVEAAHAAEEFSAVVRAGKPVPMLPH